MHLSQRRGHIAVDVTRQQFFGSKPNLQVLRPQQQSVERQSHDNTTARATDGLEASAIRISSGHHRPLRQYADVVNAVNFAHEQGLVIAVRSGGHSVAGFSVCDGGMLIDLAGLKKIDVDPEARTALCGGGVLWGEFDAATQQHGLHTPGASRRPGSVASRLAAVMAGRPRSTGSPATT
jgi:hypothetical protein